VKGIMEKIRNAILSFFVLAILLYIGACYIMRVWWVLVIVAVIALIVLLCIRFGKSKPKY
jgi:Flp pilus assembly protein TadB